MDTLQQEVEQTIRRFYGFGSNIDINNVDVQFGVSTQANGALPQMQAKTIVRKPTNRIKNQKVTPSNGKGRMSLHREYTTSKEDIGVIRSFFAKWEKDKTLTPEEASFINSTKGIRYPMLDDERKNRMLRMFKGIRERKLFEKKGEEAVA